MSPFRFVAAVLAICLFTSIVRAQPVAVQGHVLGADGRPTKQAHVKLTTAGGDELAVVRADGDGQFSLAIDSTGIYRLLLAGVDHGAEVIPLFVDGTTDTVRVDVRLSRLAIRDDLAEARIVGDFNSFSARHGEIPLERQGDGTYAAFVGASADTLAYQLVDVMQGEVGGVNGPQANRYEYDYSGGYRSIVEPTDGYVRIVLNPRALPVTSTPAVVEFADSTGSAATFAGLVDVLDELGETYDQGFRELRRRGLHGAVLDDYFQSFDWSPGGRALSRSLNGAEKQALRDALYAAYFTRVIRPDSTLARQALREVEPTSEAWTSAPTALGRALERAGDDLSEAYRERVVLEHPSDDVRAFVLYDEITAASESGDDAALRVAYAQLTTAFPEHRYASIVQSRYAPDRVMQVGNPVPAFTVPALDDETTVYSDSSFAGEPLLIDFWATWCAPCVREMPYLHDAYERFGPSGLRILSLSFDRAPGDVSRFRQGDWPMPWQHAFVEGGFDSDLAETFAIDGIPAPVLVGPSGKILAMGMELRGELLGETLQGHIGGAAAQRDE